MLEKNKNYIEFSMRSMMVTHKPYQEDTDIAITGMIPGCNVPLANNPFDIPCNVVMVSKRDFERLQTENEELKKKLEEFSPIPEYREFITALYPREDVDKIVWATGQLCCGRDMQNALQADLEFYRTLYSSQSIMLKELDRCVDDWQTATGCSTPEEAKRKIKLLIDDINVLMRVSDNLI